ncbi:hypothetical protein Lesp02_61240 [Lentzea sp. NBRC 105346]|uniref:nSTAND3 domain-containing NTPase n=1 Tax=Lentzea sp. NBRC 105346 TaxID=3032205 RepID=UPI002552DADE|nr:restriction endonuclease [Lentzea sp. NBRC 105346]GLZ33936.1 hypothetical protein Lesp02_61240 [Lentzea sp. NBRC 105346]
MPRRNYQELSPYDFECLIRDLLGAEWKQRLESFPAGADGGIDVRLLRTEKKVEIVVQCKHSPGKSWSGISSSLAREASKIRDKRWGEYWLATSACLSPGGKEKAAALFVPQRLVPEHVLGCDDIDMLLNEHPGVERSNYKLYLTSVAVLELLLHNDLFVHAQDLLVGIESRRKYYVQGRALAKAQSILDDGRVCIISGPPGVGKTTLAEMIALNLIEEGYRPIWVSEDAREADAMWRSGEKQFFLYDDFLGKNSLAHKFGINGDARLLALINRVKGSSNHYLIMTTREYILSAARQTYELLREPVINYSKLIVDLSSYSEFHRAHILYNHIYFSELGADARKALLEGRAYRKVITHHNYNPRLVRLIIDSAIANGGDDAGRMFVEFMMRSLNNPTDLWGHIFTQQLSEIARDMLIVLLTLDSQSELGRYRSAVKYYRDQVRGGSTAMEEIQNGLTLLDGAFINVFENRDGQRMVGFANPGIADYLFRYLRDNAFIFPSFVEGASLSAQVVTLWKFVQADGVRRGELFLPEMVSEFKRSPQALLDAMVRVIASGAESGKDWSGFPNGSDSLERVAVIALSIAKQRSPSVLWNVRQEVCRRLIPRWKNGKGDRHWALNLISGNVAVFTGDKQGLVLVDAARRWFSANLKVAHDYVRLRDLELALDEDGKGDEGWVRDEFLEFVKDELQWLTDFDDLDSLTYELDELKAALRRFDVYDDDVESYLNEVERHAAELEKRYPDEDDNGEWRGGGWDGSDDDGDVDHLFSSLA